MIPKLSAPLAKAIRTIEGVLVSATNVALIVGASIPSAHLSVKEAGILAAVNNGALILSRTLIKVTAAAKGVGLDPITPSVMGSLATVAPLAGEVIGDVAADTSGKVPSAAAVGEQVATIATEASTDAQEIANPAPAEAPAPVADPAPAVADAAPVAS